MTVASPPPTSPGEVSTDLGTELKDDYTTAPVPRSHRKSQTHMTLVWITGNAGFSTLYTGYQLQRGGLSLLSVLLAALVGNVILGTYWMFASYLGAKHGQTETLLARSYVGRWGSYIVSILIVVASLGWYSFQANLLAEATTGLLNIPQDLAILSLVAGLVMMFNNLFGFTSVSIWAKYVAAPILIVWVVWAFAKAFATTPSHVLWSSPHVASSVTFGVAASTVIGAVIWGSEPDFWRWAKPKPTVGAGPIVIAMFLGSFLFPLAGAAIALTAKVDDFGKVVSYITNFTLGATAVAVIVFIVTQIAINDLNLYEVVTAAKNVFRGPRWIYVLLLGSTGAVFAYFQIINYYTQIAEMTGVMVPCVTVVMILDAFVVPRLFKLERPVRRVPDWRETGQFNLPGIVAIVCGVAAGGFTGGIFIPSFTWFIAPLNAWVIVGVLYLAGVAVARAVCAPDTLYVVLGYSMPARAAVLNGGRETTPERAQVNLA